MRLILIAYSLLLILNGCVAIPNLSPEPFEPELEGVERGKTCKSEFTERFGTPLGEYHERSELLYRSTDWTALIVAGAPTGVGGGTIDRVYYLWAKFDAAGVLAEYAVVAKKQGRAPSEFKSIAAAALHLNPGEVEFLNRALAKSTRGCDSFSDGLELTKSGTFPRYFAYGPDYVAMLTWFGFGYEQEWKYRFDDVTALTDEGWLDYRCFVLDFGDGFSKTIAMSSGGGGLAKYGLTRTVSKELKARIDSANSTAR